jgi:hypothetical protein
MTATAVTLIAGGSYAARETAARDLLQTLPAPAGVILEGLPDGRDLIGAAFAHLPAAQQPRVARLPPGCPCCAGNLVVRVTLNRMLRPRPAHLVLGIADPAHRAALRAFLGAAPYDALLALGDDIVLD